MFINTVLEKRQDGGAEEVLKLFKIEKLKEEQSAIFKCILEGRDCMALLPTGFGKSLPYQMTIVQQKMKGEDAKKIVVCCPLTALMKDQFEKLSRIPNVRAIYRGKLIYLKRNYPSEMGNVK